jgi:hypothetical protein
LGLTRFPGIILDDQFDWLSAELSALLVDGQLKTVPHSDPKTAAPTRKCRDHADFYGLGKGARGHQHGHCEKSQYRTFQESCFHLFPSFSHFLFNVPH